MTKYRFDWKLSLFVLLLLPLLLRLGFWQLAREQEKLALQASWEARQAEVPVLLEQLDPADDLQYRQVRLVGSFDNAHVFLLDNRIHQGRVGFEVVQPFVTNQGQIVFVNRGWLEQGPDRQTLPVVPLLETPKEVPKEVPMDAARQVPTAAAQADDQLSLSGTVYVPVGDQLVLGDIAPGPDWPKLMQTLDIPELARLAGYDAGQQLFPYSVRLAEGSAAVLQRNWSVISTTPEKHRGYAVQWFVMAAVLVLLYFYYSMRSPVRSERDTEETK